LLFHVGAFLSGREGTYMSSQNFNESTAPVLITLARAATLLSVSRRTVVRLCDRGLLEVVRLTADTPRVRMADVMKLADGK
jgi:hypothetical protein